MQVWYRLHKAIRRWSGIGCVAISEFDINEIISTAKPPQTPRNNDIIDDDWYTIYVYQHEIGTDSHF